MKLEEMAGSFEIHNDARKLNDFKTDRDARNMTLNALYAAKNKEKIRFAFELGMDSVQLHRFVQIIPAIDSIMPLLNSMEGIIKAEIAATTDIDSTMNIILPTLTAAIKLHGDSLVLFDSETFASISKMLRFKNKKRNLIDDMTVELIVQVTTL